MDALVNLLRFNREFRLLMAAGAVTGYSAATGHHIGLDTFVENWFALRVVFAILRRYWPFVLLCLYLIYHALPEWLHKAASTLPPPHI